MIGSRRERLTALHVDGEIDVQTYAAALLFALFVVRAEGRAHAPAPVYFRRPTGYRREPSAALTQYHALANLRRIEAYLGPFDHGLVWACAVDDLSWRMIGRTHGVNHETARSWTVAALLRLPVALASLGMTGWAVAAGNASTACTPVLGAGNGGAVQ